MARISSRPIMILDGGMSRELISLNAPFQQPEWSAFALLESPAFVKQAHQQFVAAGADVLTTNSYALVPFHIGEERFFSRGKELASLAGRLAREVATEEAQRVDGGGRKVLVAGSLPPIFGSYRPDLFNKDKAEEHLTILVEGLSPYIDVWLGETLSLIAEAEAVLTAVKDTGKKCWFSFTLDDETTDVQTAADIQPRLRSGERVADVARWVASNHTEIEALLFNCSQPEFMGAAIREAKEALAETNCDIRLGVYANAFAPKPKGYEANKDIVSVRRDLDAELYLDFAKRWVEDGASIVGGCCGIGHDYIAMLNQKLKIGASSKE